MQHRFSIVFTLIIGLFCGTLLYAPVINAQGEPVLAPEIGRLIEEEGIEAAKTRFAELIESETLDTSMEIQGLMTLTVAYMQAGNQEAADAVGKMAETYTQKAMASMMNTHMPQMAEGLAVQRKTEQAAKEQRQREVEEENRLKEKMAGQARGKRRDDLNRFTGLYGAAGNDDMGRTLFVTVSCDGYLVTGSNWGDVSPWWMRSAADKVFTYSDSWTNISMEFEVDSNGQAIRMIHDLEGVESPLKHKGPLPDDWEDCLPPLPINQHR